MTHQSDDGHFLDNLGQGLIALASIPVLIALIAYDMAITLFGKSAR